MIATCATVSQQGGLGNEYWHGVLGSDAFTGWVGLWMFKFHEGMRLGMEGRVALDRAYCFLFLKSHMQVLPRVLVLQWPKSLSTWKLPSSLPSAPPLSWTQDIIPHIWPSISSSGCLRDGSLHLLVCQHPLSRQHSSDLLLHAAKSHRPTSLAFQVMHKRRQGSKFPITPLPKAMVDFLLMHIRLQMLIQRRELAEFAVAEIAFVVVAIPSGFCGDVGAVALVVPGELLVGDGVFGIALLNGRVNDLAVQVSSFGAAATLDVLADA